MKAQQLTKVARKIGREGVSLLAQQFIQEYDGSYKGAMQLAGKLSVIAKMSTFDDYWHEQVNRGEQTAFMRIEQNTTEGK